MKRRRVKNKRISLLTDFIIALVICIIMFSVSFITKTFKNEELKETSSYQTPTSMFSKRNKARENQNKALAKEILDEYKIEVNYGKETKDNVSALDATCLEDENIIYDNLKKLKETLLKYPQGFFNEFKNESNNYSVSIYLVDKFSSRNVALATRNTNNEFKIYISNDEEFEKVLHHELYHIIEYYIKLEYDINKLYRKWNDYNPQSYIYPENVDDLDDKYVYKEGNKSDRVYFVSKYAKTNEKEDRAETFSDMMYRENKIFYYSKEHPVFNKANLISEVLEKSFKSVREDQQETWERFLK